jgi:hypothetical protein
VSFYKNITVYVVENWSDDRTHTIWYSEKEYDTFHLDCSTLATQIEKKITFNPSKASRCGLESWTQAGYRQQVKHRQDSLTAVLDVQDAQWDSGEDYSERLAEVYHARAQWSTLVAVTRAVALERKIQQLYAIFILESPKLYIPTPTTSSYMAVIRSLADGNRAPPKPRPNKKHILKKALSCPVSFRAPTRYTTPQPQRRRRVASTSPQTGETQLKKKLRDSRLVDKDALNSVI